LTVGTVGSNKGFKGWLDEVKLLAYEPSYELACNHARGTLMELKSNATGIWKTRSDAFAALYPAANTLIKNALAEGYTHYPNEVPGTAKYVCYYQWRSTSEQERAQRGNPRTAPSTLHSIREMLIQPGGPLRWDDPRPDSTTNAFCLTCHHAAGKGGLDIMGALAKIEGTDLTDDTRRQPMNPPRLLHGTIPKDYFGPNQPPVAIHGTGTHIDSATFSGGAFVWP
jgi:hypothetical protein